MTHITCRLTAKNRDLLRNPTLGNRVWAAFTFLPTHCTGNSRGLKRTITMHAFYISQQGVRWYRLIAADLPKTSSALHSRYSIRYDRCAYSRALKNLSASSIAHSVTPTAHSVTHSVARSTQPCIPPGSLNRVPASPGERAGMSPLPGGR